VIQQRFGNILDNLIALIVVLSVIVSFIWFQPTAPNEPQGILLHTPIKQAKADTLGMIVIEYYGKQTEANHKAIIHKAETLAATLPPHHLHIQTFFYDETANVYHFTASAIAKGMGRKS